MTINFKSKKIKISNISNCPLSFKAKYIRHFLRIYRNSDVCSTYQIQVV